MGWIKWNKLLLETNTIWYTDAVVILTWNFSLGLASLLSFKAFPRWELGMAGQAVCSDTRFEPYSSLFSPQTHFRQRRNFVEQCCMPYVKLPTIGKNWGKGDWRGCRRKRSLIFEGELDKHNYIVLCFKKQSGSSGSPGLFCIAKWNCWPGRACSKNFIS